MEVLSHSLLVGRGNLGSMATQSKAARHRTKAAGATEHTIQHTVALIKTLFVKQCNSLAVSLQMIHMSCRIVVSFLGPATKAMRAEHMLKGGRQISFGMHAGLVPFQSRLGAPSWPAPVATGTNSCGSLPPKMPETAAPGVVTGVVDVEP